MQGLFNLLLYFDTDKTIKVSGEFTKGLLVHPALILSKVHNLNVGKDHGHYLQFLGDKLNHMFPKTAVSQLVSNRSANEWQTSILLAQNIKLSRREQKYLH